MRRLTALAAAALLAVSANPVFADKAPESWDGLVRVQSKQIAYVYLLPDADFRAYTKVMLDPTQVSFRKNWQRDQNSSARGLSRRVDDEHAREILDEAAKRFDEILRKAYQDAGYQIVTQPGEDVLHIATAIINLDVQAPDTQSAGRSYTFSAEAGQATLVLEAKDSLSAQTLGRAVDARTTGDTGPYIRNVVTNIAEFERLFSRWAKRSAEGLGELKTLSPIDADGALKKR